MIQLTKDSEWITELGHSLSHVMASLSTFDAIPYAYLVLNTRDS